MSDISAREALSSAIRYWEPRRVLYNAALVAVVAAVFLANLPWSRSALNFDVLQRLFVLAVLANVLYCAAYVADVVAQLSSVRPGWLKLRWLLLVTGVAFAAVLANFLSHGLLAQSN